MQLIQTLVILCAMVCHCFALTAKDAHLVFPGSGKRGIMIGSITSDTNKLEQPVVIDSLTETIELSIAVPSSDKPSQVTLLLGIPERDLEAPYEAIERDNGDLIMYKFTIAIAEVQKALLYFATTDDVPLSATLILAKEGHTDENLLLPLFDMQLTFPDQIEYKNPSRFGAKPEIHHIFNAEPKTIPWPVAQIFVFFITAVTFFLVISWMSSGAINFSNVPTGFNFVYFLAFIASIMGFEYIFTRYYSGSSIFETLYAATYLGIPSLWIGTKFLRNFAKTI